MSQPQREILGRAATHVDNARTKQMLGTFEDRVHGLVGAAEGLANPELQVTVTLMPSISTSGFESPTAQRLVVGFGRDDAPVSLGLAFFRRTEGNIDVRAPRETESE